MTCPNCHAPNPEGVRFCSICGAPLSSIMPPADVVPIAGSHGYAGFWLRVAAYFIDSLIFTPIVLIPLLIIAAIIGVSAANSGTNFQNPEVMQSLISGVGFLVLMLFQVVVIVGAWLYFALMESSRHQGTVGKRVVGLIVTDMSGNRISFGKASARFFGKMISGFTMGIGYLMAAFTERRQTLHDIIAGCLVLRK